jgi:hypothetical protein
MNDTCTLPDACCRIDPREKIGRRKEQARRLDSTDTGRIEERKWEMKERKHGPHEVEEANA